MRISPLVLILATALTAAAQSPWQPQLQALQQQSGGVLGISAWCIETGARAGINQHIAFPMASTYKFPIALTFLHQVKQGMHRLEDSVTVGDHDLRPGRSPLAEQIQAGQRRRYTWKELLQWMMMESDNTACDKILQRVGGTHPVNEYIHRHHIRGMRVDRDELALNADALGIKHLPHPWKGTLSTFDSLVNHLDSTARNEAIHHLLRDARDTSTPQAMADLLHLFQEQKLKEFDAYDLLRQMMIDTPTGANRIKAQLPAGTIVAHKTGGQYTSPEGINGATNDVAIITSPDGKRHILMAVLMKGATADESTRERIMAESARLLYDALMKPAR